MHQQSFEYLGTTFTSNIQRFRNGIAILHKTDFPEHVSFSTAFLLLLIGGQDFSEGLKFLFAIDSGKLLEVSF